MLPPSLGSTVANFQYDTVAPPHLELCTYSTYFDPLTSQPCFCSIPPPQRSFPTSMPPNCHHDYYYPHNCAQFISVSPQATWQTVGSCISPFDPQSITILLSQPNPVRQLSQLLDLQNSTPLNPESFGIKVYHQKYLHVPNNRFFFRYFPKSPLHHPLDCQFRLHNFSYLIPCHSH